MILTSPITLFTTLKNRAQTKSGEQVIPLIGLKVAVCLVPFTILFVVFAAQGCWDYRKQLPVEVGLPSLYLYLHGGWPQ